MDATLRPGKAFSADDWEDLLVPEIDQQQAEGQPVAFRADAAFAKPAIYADAGNAGCRVRDSHPGLTR